MTEPTISSPERGQWTSRVGFILAAAGSAVGLGNIWRFPYVTGENGGGLFVLIYLVCIVLVGIPIMAAEIMIGRSARRQPVVAFEKLQGGKTGWSFIGWLGLIAGFVILSYYVVVAGWSMDYALKSFANFTDPIAEQAEKEALAYRADTPIAQMRADLVELQVNRAMARIEPGLRGQLPESAWKAYRQFDELLKKRQKADGDVGQLRRVLLENEESQWVRKVLAAEEIELEIREIRKIGTTWTAGVYDSFPDVEVRDEAQLERQRQLVGDKAGEAFGTMVTDGWAGTFWSLIFMLLVILVVAGGISGGIERACKIMMPGLFVLMLLIVFYGFFQPGFGDAISFVFEPDPSRIKPSSILEALGQSFFTLSLGMGAMITYGSYQAKKEHLLKQTTWIAGLDTSVALLACLMIFPITFSFGQPPAGGAGLVFKSLPLAFAEMPGGPLIAIVFFTLLVVAALTSAISLLEVVASYFIDRLGWTRRKAAWILGGAIMAFGVLSAFAFDPDFALSSWSKTYGQSFFDTMDYLATNWLLPVGGLLIAIYGGWVMPKKLRQAELEGMGATTIMVWLLLLRYVAPILVLLVLIQKVGFVDIDDLFFIY